MDAAPLILTLRFDERSFERFDSERRRHFPPERNLIPAHLTLFHHLPGRDLEAITEEIETRCAAQPAFPVLVSRLRSLGHGVAYVVESSNLTSLREDLAGRWASNLTRQDAQGFRPHVTIQNKVSPGVAQSTYQRVSSSFAPFKAWATGLLLWHYRDGPWEAAGEFAFRRASD